MRGSRNVTLNKGKACRMLLHFVLSLGICYVLKLRVVVFIKLKHLLNIIYKIFNCNRQC